MPRLLSLTLTVLAVLAVLAVGVFLGARPALLPGSVRAALVPGSEAERTRDELLRAIEANYFRPVDVERLRERSLKAIVGGLGDRFSSYLAPAEARIFQERVSGGGEFEGVGMSVQPDRRGLFVAEVFRGSPAERAGIHKGDVIAAVNGDSLAGVSTEAATARIRGRPGTSVRLAVIAPRSDRRRSFEVKRARVEVPVALGRMERRGGKRIGVVRLTTFSSGAHGVLRAEIDRLLRGGAQAILLDLRGNGGGLLQEAVLVSSIFIEDGLIVSTDGRTKPHREFDAEGDAIDGKIPVAVLVDRGSASASEIVTGALRDRRRGVVVGTRTFGKGVFQEVESLPNGGALSLTVGQYFLPSGENISHRGVVPSVRARDIPRTRPDEALPKALEALGARIG